MNCHDLLSYAQKEIKCMFSIQPKSLLHKTKPYKQCNHPSVLSDLAKAITCSPDQPGVTSGEELILGEAFPIKPFVAFRKTKDICLNIWDNNSLLLCHSSSFVNKQKQTNG